MTLVEYADFECPYCGQAEPIIRGLLDTYGAHLRYVFQHLPLTDVHPHAEMAAEAAESAGADGKFWEITICSSREAMHCDTQTSSPTPRSSGWRFTG